MTRLSSLVLALVFSAQLLVGQASTSKAADDPTAAIPAVLHAQVDAWNRGDLKAFMDGYWKSPDLIFATGKEETRGWDLVMERYHARYQSGDNAEMGKLTFAWVDGVHVMSPEFAYIDGEYRLTMSTGKESHGVFTLIFRKLPDGWRIVHDRTCAQ
jgi:ketosteroid isomerase-like protein